MNSSDKMSGSEEDEEYAYDSDGDGEDAGDPSDTGAEISDDEVPIRSRCLKTRVRYICWPFCSELLCLTARWRGLAKGNKRYRH